MKQANPSNPSASANRLLMVDDRPLTLRGFQELVAGIYGSAWSIEIFEDANELLNLLDHEFPNLPSLVSVDLGLPPEPKTSKYGLKLLSELNKKYQGIKLVVHSQLLSIDDSATQYILSIPASFISLFNDSDIHAYAGMLPWLAQGFKAYSPQVSAMLGKVVINQPDPLYDDEWILLALLAAGKTNHVMAQDMHFSEARVAEKIAEIATKLQELGHIKVVINDRPVPNKYRDALTGFYKANAVRYRRLPNS